MKRKSTKTTKAYENLTLRCEFSKSGMYYCVNENSIWYYFSWKSLTEGQMIVTYTKWDKLITVCPIVSRYKRIRDFLFLYPLNFSEWFTFFPAWNSTLSISDTLWRQASPVFITFCQRNHRTMHLPSSRLL